MKEHFKTEITLKIQFVFSRRAKKKDFRYKKNDNIEGQATRPTNKY